MANRRNQILGLCAIAGILLFAVFLGSRSARVFGLLLNSFKVAGLTCAVSLPIGTFLGFTLFRTNVPCKRIFQIAFLAVLFVPLYVQAAAWDAGFGRLGWFPMIGDANPQPILRDWFALIWIHAMASLPWVVLIVGLGSTSADRDLEEFALLEMPVFKVFAKVTLPRSIPSIIAAAIWILVATFGEMAVADIYGVRTFAEEVYLGYSLNELGVMPFSGVMENDGISIDLLSQILVSGCLLLSGIYFVVLLAPISDASGRSSKVFDLKVFRIPAMAICLLITLLVVGVPLANLVFKAGQQFQPTADGVVEKWSIAVFWQNLSDVPSQYGMHFYWTFAIGIVAAAITTLFAIPLAWLARSLKIPYSIPTILIVIGAFAIPAPTVGIIAVSIFNRPEIPGFTYLYDRTIVPLAFACAIRALPVTTLICWHAMRQISPNVLEQAALDGAGKISRFFVFGVSACKVSIAAAFLFAVIISIAELSAIILVSPPRIDPVQRLVFGLIHAGVDDQVASLCLSQMILIVPMTLIVVLMARRRTAFAA